MTLRGRSTIRAVAAGVAIGAGVGLGAHNGWLMALLAGVALLATGVVLSPRPRRVDGLPAWTPSRPGIEVRVDAVTRSTLGPAERQLAVVSATVAPPDDTPYEARWLASMSRAEFDLLLATPDTEMSPLVVPARDRPTTPGFDDVPGRATVLYPIITALVALAVILVVPANTWHVDVDMSSSTGAAGSTRDDDADSITDPSARLDDLRQHVATLGAQAGANVLTLTIDVDGDRIEVLSPGTGEVVSASYSTTSRRWLTPSTHQSAKRRADTFALDDLARFDADTVAATMRSRVPATQRALRSLTITRPRQGEDPLATAELGADTFTGIDVQARMTGEVADVFDASDLATSMRIGQDVMRSRALPFDSPVLTRFEIRGTRRGTPIMRAGSIQNSGGVLIEYTTVDRVEGVTVVPGEFPETVSSYDNSTGRLQRGALAPNRLSAAVFERVRDDAMRRGRVEDFDREAIDISAGIGGYRDDYGPTIWVAVGPGDASRGTYSPDGAFLRPGIS
ncbi:hypothetical protein ASG12_08400 [Williamsia sp. Leaf354]|uniref:hypothetical protein n=1 Tax=Williamsia sp. Leaf354 TaxID=1736349 RepID=UPI0006F2A0F8|nr:hypothetical protein [Williamsia sp. Leaf354]KQR98458.1 hypothetical protein ASG12_08400 [Williamsia sp. Leaf354]